MSAAGVVMVKLTSGNDDRLAVAIIVALAIGALVGLINGLIIHVLNVNAMITTLSVNLIVANALVLWAGVSLSISGRVPSGLSHAFQGNAGNVSYALFYALVLCLVVWLTLRNTRLGHRYVAVGTNYRAAYILGVPIRAYRIMAYVLSGVLTASAGIALSGLVSTPDNAIGIRTCYRPSSLSAWPARRWVAARRASRASSRPAASYCY